METEKFDLIVIGGGPAGYVASIRAAQLGLKTACIEKRRTLGGTCLNVGCIPSKALLESSEHYIHAKTKLQKHGISVENVRLDLAQMMKRKEAVVRQLTNGIMGLFKKNGVTQVTGVGKLISVKESEKQVRVVSDSGERLLSAPRVLLATGSEPASLPFLPFDGKKILSSTEVLSLAEIPNHLVVIGGGVIGLEMGSVWLRLGAKVTVIEYMERILPTVDAQMANEVHKALVKQGMEFKVATKCLGARTLESGELVVDLAEVASGAKSELSCDYVLVSTGRKPFSEGLGLEELGIKKDKAGRVEVDSHYQTAVPGVYAVGDLIAGPMLAHKAEEEGVAVVELMAGQAGHVNYNAIPNVVYTWPEFASVGLGEEELKAKGITEYKVGTFPFLANGRARSMEETDGIVKILSDAKTDRVLGVHIVGPRASELIAEATIAIEFDASAEDIARTCHAHPTLSEVVKEAALAVDRRAIHM